MPKERLTRIRYLEIVSYSKAFREGAKDSLICQKAADAIDDLLDEVDALIKDLPDDKR